MRDGRVARAGQESRAIVDLRHVVRGVAARRPNAKAPPRLGQAQQSRHGREPAQGGAAAAYKILSCPLHDRNGSVLGLVALFRSAEREDFEPRDVRILEFVGRKAVAILDSEYDALTGLPNRAIFERRAQRALDRAATAMLYVDVDELEAINGAFGLSAGDEVIQRVGTLVQQAAGPDALVCRLAGDRFAIVLPERAVAQSGDDRRRDRSLR